MKSKRATFLTGIMISVLSIVITLLMAEGLVRIFDPQSLSGIWGSDEIYNPNKAYAIATHRFRDREVRYRINSLKQRGPEAAPDKKKVLVVFGIDDITRSLSKTLYRLNKEDSSLIRVPAQLTIRRFIKKTMNLIPGYHYLLEHSHLLQFIRTRVELLLMTHERAPLVDKLKSSRGSKNVRKNNFFERSLLLGETLFRKLKDICDTHDARLLVVTNGFLSQNDDKDVNSVFLRHAPEFFSSLEVPFHDIHPALLKDLENLDRPLDTLRIAGDGHPNERAARLIAKHLWIWLEPHLIEHHRQEGFAE